MKKSTIRTEKRPKKFRLLRAYSILSYEHPSFVVALFFSPAPARNGWQAGRTVIG